jgi:hypothetical protein
LFEDYPFSTLGPFDVVMEKFCSLIDRVLRWLMMLDWEHKQAEWNLWKVEEVALGGRRVTGKVHRRRKHPVVTEYKIMLFMGSCPGNT